MTAGLAQALGLWGLNLDRRWASCPNCWAQARREPSGPFLCPSLRPSGPPETPPRPDTFSHGPTCGAWGAPLRGQEGKRLRSGRQPPHRGQVFPGLPSLTFLEFYSFPFLRFFSVCLFFIIFQDTEKESTQQMGILQEVRILFCLSCPRGLGRLITPALFPTPCSVSPRSPRVCA